VDVNSLAAAAVVAVGGCPGRRAGHGDARDRHHDCSQGLQTSTQHHFVSSIATMHPCLERSDQPIRRSQPIVSLQE
jgi:hypothetical protein